MVVVVVAVAVLGTGTEVVQDLVQTGNLRIAKVFSDPTFSGLSKGFQFCLVSPILLIHDGLGLSVPGL